MNTMNTRSKSMSSFTRIDRGSQLIEARTIEARTSPEADTSSSEDSTHGGHSGDEDQGTAHTTIPCEAVSQVSPPPLSRNEWADSIVIGTQSPMMRMVGTPGMNENLTPGKRRLPSVPPTPIRAMIDNDQITALKLLTTDLGEITKSNATKITNIISRIAEIEQNQNNILAAIHEAKLTPVSSVPTPTPTLAVTSPPQSANTTQENFIHPRNTVPLSRTVIATSAPLALSNSYSVLEIPDSPDSAASESDQSTPQHQRQSTTPNITNNVQRRPNICCNESHLINFKPIRPGNASYTNATARGRRAFVLSDSMMQRVRKREFYQHLRNTWCNIKTFPGANARYLHHHVLPFIIEECPHTLVIHGGTNDLRNRDKTPEQIADDLISIGRTAQSLGVKNVMYSSLIIRKDGVTLDRKRNNVNQALKDKCILNNFIFVCNRNICLEDITDFDKVHLHESGSVKLANNILDAMNNSH